MQFKLADMATELQAARLMVTQGGMELAGLPFCAGNILLTPTRRDGLGRREHMDSNRRFSEPVWTMSWNNLPTKLTIKVRSAAQQLDDGHPEATVNIAMAKRYACDACFHIVDDALQLHGGYGYLKVTSAP